MKIAIGCDHIVTPQKDEVVKWLVNEGHDIIDCGTHDRVRTHYPLFGQAVGVKVATHEVDLGIVICGTGVGISNAANRIKGIRCILTQRPYVAKIAREQYNANVLAMGGEIVGSGLMRTIIKNFLNAKYQGTNTTIIQMCDRLVKHENYDLNLLLKEVENWNCGCYTNNEIPEKIGMPKIQEFKK